jgi:hypothetical protein
MFLVYALWLQVLVCFFLKKKLHILASINRALICLLLFFTVKAAKRCLWPALFQVFIQLHLGLFRIWPAQNWHQKVVLEHLIFMFLAIFKHSGDHGSNICSLIANFKLDSCSANKNNLLFIDVQGDR